MTPTPGLLRLTRTGTDGSVRIELHGSFDHRNADALLDAVTALLAEPGSLHDLHLDCAGVSAVDSSGLSTLLMIRRATDAVGVRLRLDERPLKLERMLKLTGTLDHFTRHHADGPADSATEARTGSAKDSRKAAAGGPDTI
ncbi:STAS domain-containing protein [Streptomyces sp. NPDC058623]|uniref:STAS domain-containing protein n=1 Tax=Streptomyces sp. NPDC058623 TaxID=3346563 RepID=UPI0036652E9D